MVAGVLIHSRAGFWLIFFIAHSTPRRAHLLGRVRTKITTHARLPRVGPREEVGDLYRYRYKKCASSRRLPLRASTDKYQTLRSPDDFGSQGFCESGGRARQWWCLRCL
ncbi:hypothetical protein BDM02DRAFT_3257187 [Thelephora ganbajun]|uniref:Uncharacterized protein n=1 Tax=Thelephora ganbajun TaxID=370292 RepID=A0ACB6ZXG1_THEGA|nr:hypothetical protein BDM02DRAFT_3257187 [Thelephora ganbajun]